MKKAKMLLASLGKVKHKRFAIFAVLFGIIGVVLLIRSFAAVPANFVEPEDGQVSGNASVVSDSMASGGKYVSLGTTASACPAELIGTPPNCVAPTAPKPMVMISLNPSTINAGTASSVTWSATNTPTACDASGSAGAWTGSKGASGTTSTGNMSTAGKFTYTLTCKNDGGSASASATLTVASVSTTYCGGASPCYGVSEMALHATVGNCWAWNSGTTGFSWVFNITSYKPHHPGGASSGSVEGTTASPSCNKDIHQILIGGEAIAGYRDSGGRSVWGHSVGTVYNSGGSMGSYRLGYYDPNKP